MGVLTGNAPELSLEISDSEFLDEPRHAGDLHHLLYVGAIGQGKGIRTLLRAMAEVAKTSPNRLVMVGPMAAGFEAPLRAAIAELGLSGRVEVRGALDHEQMPALIAAAGICVTPAAPDLAPRPYALYPTRLLERHHGKVAEAAEEAGGA